MAYRDEPLETEDYVEAAKLYNICRSGGVECGPVDILICAVALRRKWQVLSNDSGLSRCMELVQARHA